MVFAVNMMLWALKTKTRCESTERQGNRNAAMTEITTTASGKLLHITQRPRI